MADSHQAAAADPTARFNELINKALPDGRQALLDSRRNLEEVARYCEQRYETAPSIKEKVRLASARRSHHTPHPDHPCHVGHDHASSFRHKLQNEFVKSRLQALFVQLQYSSSHWHLLRRFCEKVFEFS